MDCRSCGAVKVVLLWWQQQTLIKSIHETVRSLGGVLKFVPLPVHHLYAAVVN